MLPVFFPLNPTSRLHTAAVRGRLKSMRQKVGDHLPLLARGSSSPGSKLAVCGELAMQCIPFANTCKTFGPGLRYDGVCTGYLRVFPVRLPMGWVPSVFLNACLRTAILCSLATPVRASCYLPDNCPRSCATGILAHLTIWYTHTFTPRTEIILLRVIGYQIGGSG